MTQVYEYAKKKPKNGQQCIVEYINGELNFLRFWHKYKNIDTEHCLLDYCNHPDYNECGSDIFDVECPKCKNFKDYYKDVFVFEDTGEIEKNVVIYWQPLYLPVKRFKE